MQEVRKIDFSSGMFSAKRLIKKLVARPELAPRRDFEFQHELMSESTSNKAPFAFDE